MDFVEASGNLLKLMHRASDGLMEVFSNREVAERIDRVPTKLGPYGVDDFGFDPEYLKRAASVSAWLYRHYFRVQTSGLENIPDGRCIVVANHSGQLPFDAAMLSTAVLLDREPPRYLRSMIERFVPATPFASMFLARCGQILGSPENCRRLLQAGEAILVFPEGVRGLNKTWSHRYQLQRFGQGFMRLAIETETPIIPAVVIGAEEQSPTLFNFRSLGKRFGLPAFPITLSPGFGALPLPVRYRISFGSPMVFEGNANDEDAVIIRKVDQVKASMQRSLEEGLANRTGVFV